MDLEAVALIFIFLGVITRTLLPAARKWKDATSSAKPEDEFHWDNKYTATMIISILTSVIVTIMAFPLFSIPITNSIYVVASAAFIFGIGLNEIIIEISEWA